ncbi:macro domain-containing protein [Alkalicoccus urumqiensis]|uniref:RNase III inhibitor n=1 Tax=Alkalicoccus urumqiensis TaxID=1548213 RepID=A0A2P6MLV8_ALKUR|nr:macro domain-containing protein [Alkalicoccus urumqiensis]PRO67269.1 RNase III inhibitor [Alkalicoccus urumqiensis]
MQWKQGTAVLEVIQGDIAAQPDIDVVVNAANAQLETGGGVAGALHRAAGPELAEAGRSYAPVQPGEAVMTDAFSLPNKAVVHCLGPVYGRDEPSDVLLASCYSGALRLADKEGYTSIAFPALSTGAFGYPLEEAIHAAVPTVLEALRSLEHVTFVRFVLFSNSDKDAYIRELEFQIGPGSE